MRLWTLHPKYLDWRGFCGLWREALLAQAVLSGSTKGYREHPQLERFKQHADPCGAIGAYLAGLHVESVARGYDFDRSRIVRPGTDARIRETEGQLLWEWGHLKAKLGARAPDLRGALSGISVPEAHPMFDIVPGPVRAWERGAADEIPEIRPVADVDSAAGVYVEGEECEDPGSDD